LQRKLVKSFEARALAVRRVTTNQGKNTPGIDNIVWNTDNSKIEAITRLKNLSKYESSPVKRVYIPKENSKELRPLGILTMFDRVVQALFYIALLHFLSKNTSPITFG